MKTHREKSLASLTEFKRLRDAVNESDNAHEIDQALANLVDFLDVDAVVAEARANLPNVNWAGWWAEHQASKRSNLKLPVDREEKAAILLESVIQLQRTDRLFNQMMSSLGVYGLSKSIDHFKSVVFRPAMELFGEKMREVVELATPESRALQAVPPYLVPPESQLGIFLSHRTPDKPRVQKYYDALKNLGHQPWLDSEAMPAGTILHRGIQGGVDKSCAVVFFLTENFTDERWLAAEIDHAIERYTKLGADRFSIITLRFSPNAVLPRALERFVFKSVENDLEGFDCIIRALPIQLGPARWRQK